MRCPPEMWTEPWERVIEGQDSQPITDALRAWFTNNSTAGARVLKMLSCWILEGFPYLDGREGAVDMLLDGICVIRQRAIDAILELGTAILEDIFVSEVEEEVCCDFITDGVWEGYGGFLAAVKEERALDLVLEVLADAGEVDDGVDAVVGEELLVTDAGEFEDWGGAVGACREDDFFAGFDCLLLFG